MKSKGIISATLEGRWEKQLEKGHWAPLVPVIMLSLQLHCEYPDIHFIYVCNTYMVQTLNKITYIFFLLYMKYFRQKGFCESMNHES